jgi:hypothetical protein
VGVKVPDESTRLDNVATFELITSEKVAVEVPEVFVAVIV